MMLGVGLAATAPAEITLRYAVTDGADSLGVIKQICSDFEKAHPGIRIKVEPVVDNFAQKLMAMVAANIPPDVSRMGPRDYQPLAARGALLPLDPFIAKDPSVRLADYYPNMVQFFRYDGKLWALPREVAPTGIIYYNKRLFREAGLPYPDPNWTWTYAPRPNLGGRDFVYLAEQLSKRDARGRPEQYGFSTAWPQLFFDTLMASRGLKLWDDNEKPTRLNATDPQVVELMNFASDFVNKNRWMPSQIDLMGSNTSQRELFLQGKLAMFGSGPWEIRRLRQEMVAPNDDWDMVPFPAYVGQPRRTMGEGSGTSIFAGTRHPEAAWKFVKWMSGPPGMTAMAQAGLNQPAIRKLANTPGIWYPAIDAQGADAKPVGIRITDAAAASMAINQVPEYFRPIADRAQGVAFDILSGVRPPEQTMRRLQADGTRDLENALRRLETQPFPFVPATLFAVAVCIALLVWVYRPEWGRKLTLNERKENRSAYLFLLPWLIGLAYTLGPMLWSFLLSFAQSDNIRPPSWVGLQNYSDAFWVDDSVLISIRQTTIYAVLSIPLGLISALLLALLLNTKVKGVPLFRALYYIPSLASGVAMSLIWMRVFNPESGILNHFIYHTWPLNVTPLGDWLSAWAGKPGEPVNWLSNTTTVIPAFVLMGMWGAGGGTIIFLAGLQGISQSYYEAATLDGAGPWKRFRNVTFPLLTPTVFFSLITGVIGALQVFTQAVVMTDGGPDRATLFYMVNLYRQAFGSLNMGYASAMAWILFVIILIITVIQLRGSRRWVHYEGELK
jgi:multiple sugar transport system permease protein